MVILLDRQSLTFIMSDGFLYYFTGTEMVVAGSLNDDVFSNVLAIKVSGNSAEGTIMEHNHIYRPRT